MTYPQDSVPLLKCKTARGSFISLLGSALPLIAVELRGMSPHPAIRWTAFGLGLAGTLYTLWRRSREQHPPVKGLWFGEDGR